MLARKRVAELGRWLRSLATLVVLMAGGGVLGHFGLLAGADTWISDLRFQLASRPVTGGLALVDIDAKSLQAIGVWPWPRTLYADLVKRLQAMGAVQIAFDIDFSANSTPAADSTFAAALSGSEVPIFLAAFGQRSAEGRGVVAINQPIGAFRAGGWPALVNVPLAADGLVRQFPSALSLGTTRLQSMPMLLAAQDKPSPISIDYTIAADRLTHYSFSDVLAGQIPPGALRGKTVIVGATALELRDFFRVPKYGTVPGSDIIALATETLLQGRDLAILPGWLASLAIALAAGVVFLFRRGWWVLLPLAGLFVATEAMGAYLLLANAEVLPTAGADLIICALAVCAVAREFSIRQLLLKLARREAANTRRMLERVVDDGFDAIVILDEADCIVRRNRRAVELFEANGLGEGGLPKTVLDAVAAARRARADGTMHPSVAELELCGSDGTTRHFEYAATPFDLQATGRRRRESAIYVAVTLHDVTERRLAAEAMHYLAMSDALTGLLNRRGFEELLSSGSANRTGAGALISFDLDRFKTVNDTHGHALGDRLLVEVAGRARACLPAGSAVARMGGDEFAALVEGAAEQCLAAAGALVEALAVPFLLEGRSVGVSASVGVARLALEADPLAVSRNADLALQDAKAQGGHCAASFHAGLEAQYRERLLLEQDLAAALDRNQFRLAFQPQVDLVSGAVTGAEALLRWHHPIRGAVSPAVFIPVAEEAGLVHRITTWVLEEACKAAAAWTDPIMVAVNLSAIDLRSGDVLELIDRALRVSGLPTSRLELEITETAVMTGGAAVAETFEAIRARGIRFAIDDFGTGYSSLGYLHRYPFSMLKIDKSFVDNGPTDAEAMTILGSVIGMARALGLKSLAEGIETVEQRDALRLLGCERGQGYLFSKPLDEAQFRDWLASRGQGSGVVCRRTAGRALRPF